MGRAGRRRTHRQLTLLAGSLFRARKLTAERIVDELTLCPQARKLTAERIVDELTLLAGSLFRARKLTAERIVDELTLCPQADGRADRSRACDQSCPQFGWEERGGSWSIEQHRGAHRDQLQSVREVQRRKLWSSSLFF